MRTIWTGLLLVVATPAAAAERDYCPTRPGLGTTACTISPGRVSVETALADWTLDQDQNTRTDTVLIGDTLVRVGLTDTIEAQLGWTPFGHVRERDQIGGIDRANRVGDAYLGMKANLLHPDGKGLSIGLAPFVTLPIGRNPVGAGDWGAGLVAHVSYDLNDTLNLQLSPEIDAAVDEDGHGRHVAVGSVVGLGIAISEAVAATLEVQATQDDDPQGATTQVLAAVSLAWMPNEDLQLDTGMNVGMNRVSPDVELYIGISRRF